MDVCPQLDNVLRGYNQQHLWFYPLTDNQLVFGITEFYQDQLSDIWSVEYCVATDAAFSPDVTVVELESAKARTAIQLPVTGSLIQRNNNLIVDPALLNQQPETAGWLGVVAVQNNRWQESLLSVVQYQRYLDQ